MKKTLALVLCLVFMLAFVAACAPATPAASDTPAPAKQEEQPAAPAVQEKSNEPAVQDASPAGHRQIEDGITYLDAPPDVKPSKDYKIAFSNASVGNSWRVYMERFLREAVKAKGIPDANYLYADANGDDAKQLSDIETLIDQKIDLLLVAANTQDGCTAAIEKAYDAGIPVILFDRSINSTKYDHFVSTPDKDIGAVAAQMLVDDLTAKNGAPKGDVVIIQSYPGSGPCVDRQAGIMSVLEKYPDINILDEQFADFLKDKGKMVMEDYLTKFDHIDAVISHSGDSICGAYEAAQAAGREKEMKWYNVDGSNGTLLLVQSGDMECSSLFPAKVGVDALNVGLAILEGLPEAQTWKRNVFRNPINVTKDNVGKFVNADPSVEWPN